ncbi:amidase [Xylanibacillus composti]|uniref:Amidase n=1 Tax=Xylanibacillus composti TaxID=1572762 RepID=A0A8J4LZZ7_9BACL|nr:amidase family protein [Xylanibacillus composti]MDT9723886.1 amidase [Xylanibacillus composti]GIQ67335.1 amidase [Xylanibacillus composti]
MSIPFQSLFKEELTIQEIQAAMDAGDMTAKQLTMYYLSRIAAYDQAGPCLKSMLEVNPDAIFIAEGLDHERAKRGARGPLHGVPVVLKDNIETRDHMHTSAGTLALAQHLADQDAFLVSKLREAGAVILGKTNMTELANGMSSSMWAGYSARGGQTDHPYGPGRDWFVGGSSSGSAVAVAANLTMVAVGTETIGSILSPAVNNAVVGIKPTTGLISRNGIIPLTYTQDTAGPLARTVKDAAILLGAMTGIDPQDAATYKSEGMAKQDYTKGLDPDGLKGARIGVWRIEDEEQSVEYDAALYDQAIHTMRGAGAEIVDNIEIPACERDWNWAVMPHEIKHSLDNYLARLPAHYPVHSIADLIAYNQQHAETALKYGQDQLEEKQRYANTLTDPTYLRARMEDLYYAQDEGVDYALKTYRLDAILFPAYKGCTISAKAGYPTIALPAGFRAGGRPFGITLTAGAFSEAKLIQLGYAYEQASRLRRPPKL